MANLSYRLDKVTPVVLILVFFAAFISANDTRDYVADIDSELSMSDDQAWVWSEYQADYDLFLDKGTAKTNFNSIISLGKKTNISKTLANVDLSLLDKTIKKDKHVSKKGKSSSVKLKSNFDKLVAKNSKLKNSNLKQAKKVANAKLNKKLKRKKFRDEAEKYKIFVSKNKWQPKNRKLSKVIKKVINSGRLSQKAVIKAFKYYEKNKKTRGLSNKYLVVADYTKSSKSKRMHLINLKNGKISSYQVAHGKRSGPVGGRVYKTSNRRQSYMTSKGFFKVGYKEGVTLKKGYKYLPITGLERANRKVGLPSRHGGRDVIIHTAAYVNKGGRSHGCFAIRPQDKKRVFGKIKGALLYSYAG